MISVQSICEIGVVGAGTMGSAIAQHFLMEGVRVRLVDISEQVLLKSCDLIMLSVEEAARKGIICAKKLSWIRENISYSQQLESLKNCNFVVEAVSENKKIKVKVLHDLEEIVQRQCLIASNTSSLSISELAQALEFPARFAGIHYFYHAAKNKLIEIIPGALTNKNNTEILQSFYNYHNKIPIVVADSPGFAVNRFFVPWLNEAVRILEEGLGTIPYIDKVACKNFGISMGPFALMNATGIPIALHAADALAEKLGNFYEPSARLRQQVIEQEAWKLEGAMQGDENKISKRLLASALGTAAQMVSEDVASIRDTDLGARLGLKWAMGPFEMINKLGRVIVQEIVLDLFNSWALPCPSILLQPAFLDFESKYIDSMRFADCGVIEINQPDTLNALNEILIKQLRIHFTELEKDESIARIIFIGRGKSFVAGADIKYFLDHMMSNNFEKIRRFAFEGQCLFNQIANSKKTTIAYLDGLTLGGGLELALCCNYRIATARAKLAFPETGIGIYPGLGGTQRTPRLVGRGIAKFLIATGRMLDAQEAQKFGLVDAVVDRVLVKSDLALLKIPISYERVPGLIFPEEKFENFSGELTPEYLDNDTFKDYAQLLSSKAPLALRKAMALIDEGANLHLTDALKLELEHITWIFSTQDARKGLEGVIARKRPVYEGA